MTGLNEVEKEILIFLLLTISVLLLISLLSYVMWKRCCQKQLRRNAANRQLNSHSQCRESQENQTGSARHGARSANERNPSSPPWGMIDGPIFTVSQPGLDPTAPHLEDDPPISFHSNGDIIQDRLPSYHELMSRQ